MAQEERYFANSHEHDQEKRRLQLLEEFLDPLARPALLQAGVRLGSHVLEVGPGAGSMVRWLAETVGPEGHVTAIDINPRFVGDIHLSNVTIRKASILEPPEGLGPFDVVYSRYVMLHLPDVRAAAETIFDLLKPGGRAVILDLNWRSLRAADRSHPLAAHFDAQMATATDVLLSAGIMDLDFGPKGAVALDAAGFKDVDSRGTTRLLRGGTREVQWYRESVAPAEAAVRAYAPERAVDTEMVYAAYDDPTFFFSSPIETITIGTRP